MVILKIQKIYLFAIFEKRGVIWGNLTGELCAEFSVKWMQNTLPQKYKPP